MIVTYSKDDPSGAIRYLNHIRWSLEVGETKELCCGDDWRIAICRHKPYEFMWIESGIDSVEFADLVNEHAAD